MIPLLYVADAVKDALNANDFGHVFKAERFYPAEADELTLGTDLRVDVLPQGFDYRLDDVSDLLDSVSVLVWIRRKFAEFEQELDTGKIALEHPDALMKLTRDIAVFFSPSQEDNKTGQLLLADGNYAAWNPEPNAQNVTGNFSRTTRVFTGVARIGFLVST